MGVSIRSVEIMGTQIEKMNKHTGRTEINLDVGWPAEFFWPGNWTKKSTLEQSSFLLQKERKSKSDRTCDSGIVKRMSMKNQIMGSIKETIDAIRCLRVRPLLSQFITLGNLFSCLQLFSRLLFLPLHCWWKEIADNHESCYLGVSGWMFGWVLGGRILALISYESVRSSIWDS